MINFSKSSGGFSLIEALMAITVSLTIVAAVYQLSFSQQQTYRQQDQTVENRQNLRAIMALMTKSIQLAGYDPTGRANANIVTSFAPPNNGFLIDYTDSIYHNMIAFTIDDDNDSVIESLNSEQIAFRLNNNNLESYQTTSMLWQPIASNIDALDFVFLDNQGIPTTNINNFRAVEISILARSTKKDSQYTDAKDYYNKQGLNICPLCPSDGYRRRLLSKTIRLRNIGLN